MKRTRFLGTAAALGAAGAVPGTALAVPVGPAAPRRAARFFHDADMNFVFLTMLGGAAYGIGDIGTALAVIDRTDDGDPASAFMSLTAAAGAERVRAAAAEAAGHRATARAAWLASAQYAHAATYFCDRASVPEQFAPTWRAGRSAMDAGFALSERPVERVRIPYEGTTLPGYLFHPDASGRPRPLLIMVNGSDGSVLDLWVLGAAEGVARGYACLAVDGPGQGAALFEQNLFFRPDWEKVITPVVDFALARADVDPRRIAIQGISQGGYWVPRALAFEHRIAAAVADPGVVDVSTTWFAHLPPAVLALLDGGQKRMFNDLMNADPAHAATLAFRARPYGFSSPYDLYAAVRRYTLAGITERITTPMLITDPDEEQFWPGQPQQLYAALRGPKELVRFTVAEGGEAHCEPLAPRLRAQRIFDWLDATL